MTNPTRPAPETAIPTTWGLAAADTVLRRYPNAAARDDDLAGHSTADLLGQTVVLTDTAALLQYVGPVLGWRPLWNAAWGQIAPPVTSVAELNIGGSAMLVMQIPNVPFVAGRRYSVLCGYCYISDAKGYTLLNVDGASSTHRTPINGAAQGEQMEAATYNYSAAVTRLGNVDFSGVTIFIRGTLAQSRLAITDVGPAANPTAVVLGADGAGVVDLERVAPEYRPYWNVAA